MYTNHKSIPPAMKKLILDETLEKRVKNVPISVCNDIITEYLDSNVDTFYEEFTLFTIEVQKDGEEYQVKASSTLEADLIMDEIIEGGDRKDVVMVLRQNDRLIRGYVDGKVVYPQAQLHVESHSPFKKRT